MNKITKLNLISGILLSTMVFPLIFNGSVFANLLPVTAPITAPITAPTSIPTPRPVSYIRLNQPNSGYVMEDSNFLISWSSSSDITHVNINIVDEYSNSAWIVTGLGNPGSYMWNVTKSGLVGSQFKIRLSGYNNLYNLGVVDYSDDYFAIVRNGPTTTPTATPVVTPTPTPVVTTTPTATPKPTATPNVVPVVSTTTLPSGTVGLLYKMPITVYDVNTTDSVAINTYSLPSWINNVSCAAPVITTVKTYKCTYSGKPTKAGIYTVRVNANDGKGGITNKYLKFTIK